MRFVLKLLRFWVLLVFCSSTVYVGINNQETITVSIPPLMTRTMTAWEAFAGFTLFGAAVVLIFFGFEHISMSWRIRKLKKRVAELEASSYAAPGAAHSHGSAAGPVAGPRGEPELLSETTN